MMKLEDSISNVVVDNAPGIMDWQWLMYTLVIIAMAVGLVFFIIGLVRFNTSSYYANSRYYRKIGFKVMMISIPAILVPFACSMIFLGVYNAKTQGWERGVAELLGPEVTVEQVKSSGLIEAVRKNSISRIEIPKGYRYVSENDEYVVEDRVFMVDGNVISVRPAESVPNIYASGSSSEEESEGSSDASDSDEPSAEE